MRQSKGQKYIQEKSTFTNFSDGNQSYYWHIIATESGQFERSDMKKFGV